MTYNLFSKKFYLVSLIILLCGAMLSAQPVISAVIDAEAYTFNNLITVEIDVQNNPGMQGIFFDLQYDGTILLLESVEPGFMVNRENKEHEFLYAVTDPLTSSTIGSHLVVSYALTDKYSQTFENGTLARLSFRVISAINSDTAYQFTFNDGQVRDIDNNTISEASWNNSLDFYLSIPQNNATVEIHIPEHNRVFYENVINLVAEVETGTGRFVKLSNQTTGYSSASISAGLEDPTQINGYISLIKGQNKLAVTLYDNLDNKLASDYVTVFYSDQTGVIEITSPGDHELVNNNYIRVTISSVYDGIEGLDFPKGVTLNGVKANPLGSIDDKDRMEYSAEIWLKEGFNNLCAEVEGPDNEKYQDNILVYYDKGDDSFQIISPYEGQVINTEVDPSLDILGEISEKSYSADTDNYVDVDFIFHPINSFQDSDVIAKEVPAIIRETRSTDGQISTPFVFELTEPLNIEGYLNGRIEIIVYKNRGSGISESRVTRFININNNHLEIIIKQPNVYDKDVLNSLSKYDILTDVSSSDGELTNTEISSTGEISLTSQTNSITHFESLSTDGLNHFYINKIIQSPEGSYYALALDEKNNTHLLKKDIDQNDWEVVDRFKDIYGYDMEYTNQGILIGASNKYQSGKTGLYLWKENELKNISIGKPISHVQFLEKRNGNIYLYGNHYLYLYSFPVYSIESVDDELTVRNVKEIPFDNHYYIDDLLLSEDISSAILLEKGKTHYYRNFDQSGFVEQKLDGKLIQEADQLDNYVISRILCNENQGGSYRSYIFVTQNGENIYALMEDKKSDRQILRLVDEGINIENQFFKAIGSDGKNIVIAYEDAQNNITLNSGRILFNQFFPNTAGLRYFQNLSSRDIIANNFQLEAFENGSIYIGTGDHPLITTGDDNSIYNGNSFIPGQTDKFLLKNQYEQNGLTQFTYHNSGAEAITGFSFEVDKKWIEQDGLSAGFHAYSDLELTPVYDSSYINGNFNFAGKNLADTLFEFSESQDYTVYKKYLSEIDAFQISVKFKNVIELGKLMLAFKFCSEGENTAKVRNIEIYKKNIVRLPIDTESNQKGMELPVYGQLTDPFVDYLLIDGKDIDVMNDGSFYTKVYLPLNSDSEGHTIELTAQNSSGEIAVENFKYSFFDSVNAINLIEITNNINEDLLSQVAENQLATEKELLYFSGEYFGLSGAVVGYEILKDDTIVTSGLFETETDNTKYQGDDYSDYTTGYDRGVFENQAVRLLPGEQQLRIYVENPGGKRCYILYENDVNDLLVDYQIPQSEQMILFENPEIEVVNNNNILNLSIQESGEWNDLTQDYDYVYKKALLINGRIRSLYDLAEINITSNKSYVLFDDNTQSTTVAVNPDNTFQIMVYIRLPENTAPSSFNGIVDLSFIPDTPFLNWMENHLTLQIKKDFKGAYIAPDFSLMQNWTDVEIRESKKAFRLKIKKNRYIPAGMYIQFILNYEDDGFPDSSETDLTSDYKTGFCGNLKETSPDSQIYRVENVDSMQDVYLYDIKPGVNRLSWIISYDGNIVSSSTSGRPGMDDGIIEIANESIYALTSAAFESELLMETYYSAADGAQSLPLFNISKDPLTEFKMVFNDQIIDIRSYFTFVEGDDNGTLATETASLDLTSNPAIKQGMNHLVVSWMNKAGEKDKKEFVFLYDSIDPFINKPSLSYDKNFTKITELQVLVKEKNLDSIYIIHDGDNMYSAERTIQQKGDDLFLVRFTMLENDVLTWTNGAIRISVMDKAGNSPPDFVISDLPQSGVERPEEAETKQIDELNEDLYSVSDIFFHHEADNTNSVPHKKFYSDDIQYINHSFDGEHSVEYPIYRIERPGTVILGDDPEAGVSQNPIILGETEPAQMVVKAGNKIVLKPGFKVGQGSELSLVIDDTIPKANKLVFERKFAHTFELGANQGWVYDGPNEFSILFQFKYEHNMENKYAAEDPSGIKKILTLYDVDGLSIFVGYKNDVNENLPRIVIAYENPIEGRQVLVGTNRIQNDNEWKWIRATVIRDAKRFKLQCEDLVEETSDQVYDDQIYEPMFKAYIDNVDPVNSIYPTYYFGDDDSLLNGHYSITNAFYMNEDTDLASAVAILPDSGLDASASRIYHFDDKHDNTTIEGEPGYNSDGSDYHYYYLRSHSDLAITEDDELFFVTSENVNYEEDDTHGSLKASRYHDNHIDIDANTGYLKMREADSSRQVSLSNPISTSTSIEFEPESDLRPGYYYFSKDSSQHGLDSTPFYSLTGEILEIYNNTELIDLDAKFIVKLAGLNNSTQSKMYKTYEYPLQYGKFHFVIPKPMTTLTNFSLIIETKSKMKISKNLVLNEGNFAIPEEYNGNISESYGTTLYGFGPNCTIRFFYKPINHNQNGLVNEPVCLIDSNYVKIYTSTGSDGLARFAAQIEGLNSSPITIESAIPVRQGWQEVMLSYSKQSIPGNSAVYLYIDGKIAAMQEGIDELPDLPIVGSEDNIFIGRENNFDPLFAEGYIDDLELISLYHLPEFSYSDPVLYDYAESNEFNNTSAILNVSLANGISESSITDIVYSLTSYQDNYTKAYHSDAIDNFGFEIQDLAPGNYLLKAEMKINGHNFNTLFSFVKNIRPRFEMAGFTPLIIEGVSKSVDFKIRYNDSYLPDLTQDILPAFVLDITGSRNYNDADVFEYSAYVCQTPEGSWLQYNHEFSSWDEIAITGETFHISFSDVIATSDIAWGFRTFYYTDDISSLLDAVSDVDIPEPAQGIIPKAMLNVNPVALDSDSDKENYYKLDVTVGTSEKNQVDSDIIDQLKIGYVCKDVKGVYDDTRDTVSVPKDRSLDLYFDDILPGYGEFDITLFIVFQEQAYGEYQLSVVPYLDITDEEGQGTFARLEILDFSLLDLDQSSNKINFYLDMIRDEIEDLVYTIKVTDGQGKQFGDLISSDIPEGTDVLIDDLEVAEGYNLVQITLETPQLDNRPKASFTVSNEIAAPELYLTNSVESLIPYNNVYFSWRGKGTEDISYKYQLDDTGWSTESDKWTSVEYFGLENGPHSFSVQAVQGGKASSIRQVNFFVDVDRPLIYTDKISVITKQNDQGIINAVDLLGESGAIEDTSLSYLFIQGEQVPFNEDGSFTISDIPITKDGTQTITIDVYDRVENHSTADLTIDNSLTHILFPEKDVLYAPAVLVGKLDESITGLVDIYLQDPSCQNKDHYENWKKARINEDRTFFIEDVYINPGNSLRSAITNLKLVTVTESGYQYTKDISLFAKEVIRPIDLNLSLHTATGQVEATEVEITAHGNVNNIASWSIDFTGDGIYDLVDVVDNPQFAKDHKWTHRYSSLGKVNPRVRIITRDGQYFSVSDELIIHEKIKEANHKIISNPIAMSVLKMEDSSDRVYVLAGNPGTYRIEVFEIGRNETYISNRLYEIDLSGLVEAPSNLLAVDESHIYLVSNRSGEGYVHLLMADEYDNYLLFENGPISVNHAIRDMTQQGNQLVLSFRYSAELATVDLENGIFINDTLTYKNVEIEYENPLESGSSLSGDSMGLLIADAGNERILRINDSFNALSYFGDYGYDEAQFVNPSIISSKNDRIFVYDETRKDIQVFDSFYQIQTRLDYDGGRSENYFSDQFLNQVVDLAAVTKAEGKDLYYYALILSKSDEKLAMVRLPQYEEMRASVRNNKIVFLKNKEVYTAKPNGSDLAQILSTDSIPRIEGTVDYPNLSPDGKTMVFTSRVELYGAANNENSQANVHAYDNLYTMDVDGKNLQRINLGPIHDYEIERPVFSSNGSVIAFSAKESGSNWQIYLYDRSIGGIEQLFESDENARFPFFSPDDKYIVFSTDYDGDEEIELVETANPAIRVSVTSNNVRDSFPIWGTIASDEIESDDYNITGKIAYVSEKGFHKGIHYSYIAYPEVGEISVVDEFGVVGGLDPEVTSTEITSLDSEGDYPSFTGDGKSVVYEYFDGNLDLLKLYSIESDNPATAQIMELPTSIRRPAGMKNMVTNFSAKPVNGNEVQLSWNPYTDNEIFYTVLYKIDDADSDWMVKKVYSQNGTRLKGMTMGQEYIFKVVIRENDEEVASSQEKHVLMPKVAAIPSYTIDKDNPYLVHFHGWTPEVGEWNLGDSDMWMFTWIIDNSDGPKTDNSDYNYEFATSGRKTVYLKVTTQGGTNTAYSAPLFIDIKSDIVPVIEHQLSDNGRYLTLNAANSRGSRIDMASASWIISGPGQLPYGPVTGSNVILDISQYKYKVNVNLKLTRVPINGQGATDIIESNRLIDLDYNDVKPVITYSPDEANSNLLNFTGEHSLGNVNWLNARWTIFADGQTLHQENGVSSFAYLFPESGRATVYTVSCTVPNSQGDGTETATALVSLDAVEIEPVIDYEIISMEEAGNITGAKIIFNASASKGNNIDFNSAKWSVPVAANYGEQATQIGPTAVYNLFTLTNETVVDVSLTLSRRGGGDPVTVNQSIRVAPDSRMTPKINVNPKEVETENGTVLYLDILKSTGPNINWEQTEWLIDGQYARKGPSVRYDVPATGDHKTVSYQVTVYRYGAQPQIQRDIVSIGAKTISPRITVNRVSDLTGGSEVNNNIELSVRDTSAPNIDWERTTWFIYDGNENVVQKMGATITHSFAIKEDAMGYPVVVNMFFKGSTKPFSAYRSVNVEGDEFVPVIQWDEQGGDPYVINFTADSTTGANIDWSQAKWTFGDSSEAQYGPAAVHKYNPDSSDRSYTVSLTLNRRSANGTFETKTVYKNITLDVDEIKPVIKAKKMGNTVVFTAEDSQGRGLMLDRSVWVFDGAGDSDSISTSTSHTDSNNSNSSVGASITYKSPEWGWGSLSATINGNHSWGDSHSDTTNDSDSFSNQNTHTGLVCRRSINGAKTIKITLTVYRVDSDGTMRGESLTKTINADNLSASFQEQ